jgi:two-component system OmpR family response regulator
MDSLVTSSQPTRRLLVVDDNQNSALTLSWAMEMYGYEVRTCYDGLSALDVALEFEPQIVLLDLNMPLINGFEVCRQLRREPKLYGTRVVAQTGLGDPETRQRTKDAGFDLHLTKPVDLYALAELLKVPAVNG